MSEPSGFTYRTTKDGRVLISWRGKQIMTLKGMSAAKLNRQLQTASDNEQQMLLARMTGHFKHGNERQGRSPS